jgi:hypothetical protein
MRIVHIGHRETAGSAYCLAHAINKLTKHKAVNITFIDSYIHYPRLLSGSSLSRDTIRKILYKANVVHFHIHCAPFFTSLRLDPQKFRDKITLMYYHGTPLRTFKEKLTAEADEYLPNHLTTVSTPDLLEYVKDGVWLPVCRSFSEIEKAYGAPVKDQMAINCFTRKKTVVFGHATSNVEKHGSKLFFDVLTNVIRGNTRVRASIIINTPWDACLRKIAEFDVSLGEAVLGVMQLTQVEAAIFKIPVVSLLTPETRALYKKFVGSEPPVVSWKNRVDLEDKLYLLVERGDVRRLLGLQMYEYAKKLHDEEAVVNRYLDILNLKS